jgi:predicted PilT family ATPase
VLTPDAIALDWEATEMRWIVPSEIQDYETVPKLEEAYRSAADGEIVK